MPVTPGDVAIELGRPTPLDVATAAQFTAWIARAERLIRERAKKVAVPYADLDPAVVDDVIRLAVATHAHNPEGAEYYDVSIDDAREMRRFGTSANSRAFITDEWWSWLFGDGGEGAFSVRPSFESDVIRWPF